MCVECLHHVDEGSCVHLVWRHVAQVRADLSSNLHSLHLLSSQTDEEDAERDEATRRLGHSSEGAHASALHVVAKRENLTRETPRGTNVPTDWDDACVGVCVCVCV